MKLPRSDKDAEAFFVSVLPKNPRIEVRPMFGNKAAFVNSNMFSGTFGKEVFVRLSEEDREELLKEKGASVFEPMHGRPMKEYVVIPQVWKEHPERARTWVSRSLVWANKLPRKKSK